MPDAYWSTVFEHYSAAYRPRRIDLPPGGEGFSGAIVRRIETDAGLFALRGWPAGANPVRLRGLHRLLAHIAERCGNIVPVPVRARSGATLVHEAGRWWQIEPWLPGAADDSATISDERLFAAMRFLSRVHLAAADFLPDHNESAWFHSAAGTPYSIAKRLRRIDSWPAARLQDFRRELQELPAGSERLRSAATVISETFERMSPSIKDQLSRAASSSVPLHSCPRDTWRAHVLFEGERATGLIDFAACRADSVSVDLARLLGSCLSNDARRWPSAIDAYSADRALSEDERTLIPLFHRSGVILSGMTWLEHWQLAVRPSQVSSAIISRMEGIAAQGRALGRALGE